VRQVRAATVNEKDWLAERFDENRPRLRALAYRMLGSASDAEDAVQDTWLKLSRSDHGEVQNLDGWLTTVVARVCLDMLRSRKSRREEPLVPDANVPGGGHPDTDLRLAEAIGPALLIVLDQLSPAERVSFVLHDMFDLSFEDIGRIVDRTPDATRQLASRARRRVRGATAPAADVARQRDVVSAFLAASRDGDFTRLFAVLSPDVVLRADPLAVQMAAARQEQGSPRLAPEVRGAAAVAETFKGRAAHASPALIDGAPGAVWVAGGQVRSAFVFTVADGRIQELEIIVDPAHLAELDVTIG
jgi:RNA polymerase sigma-70 factor (ECF subfamily)